MDRGSQVLERYTRLREDVGAHLRLEAGTVRVGGGATVVSLLLPEIIRGFRQEHPDVVFELKEAGSREVERSVVREELEVGVVTLPTQAPELEVQASHLPIPDRPGLGVELVEERVRPFIWAECK